MTLWDRLSSGARSWMLGSGQVQSSSLWYGDIPYYIDGKLQETPSLGSYLTLSNTVYVCAKMRAQHLASLPLKVYRGAGDKRKEVETGPLVELVNRVNPFWTFQRLVEMTEMSLCLWGEAYWFLERGTSARIPPKAIWWARSDRVKVLVDATEYIAGYEYLPPGAIDPIRYKREEVIRFAYPNPLDEFSGLSPIQAAMISADIAYAAQVSNASMFRNGMNMGGVVTPKGETKLSEEQAREIEQGLAKKFKGASNAHRWGVFRFEAEMKPLSMTPKDAEFLGALNWSQEEIARAYGVPLDLLGGQRTYANVGESRLAIWTDTLVPEAQFLATELTEQFLPMFSGAGAADSCEFDVDKVAVLQDAKAAHWDRIADQIRLGAIKINDWRAAEGLAPVPWGDAWWASASLVPITTAQDVQNISAFQTLVPLDQGGDPAAVPVEDAPKVAPGKAKDDPKALPPGDAKQNAAQPQTRAIAYGSREHEQLWRNMVRRTEPHEKQFGSMCAKLMRDQKQAVMSRLKRSARVADEVADNPFDLPSWIKKFREASRPLLLQIVEDAGTATLADLALSVSFDIKDPNVVRFLERRTQRFARRVNEETWSQLKASLGEGIQAGETIPQLADRVEAVMGDRIQSSSTVISRTEVIGASNGGALAGAKMSGVVTGKTWLAALDERTRETHIEAHGQTVALDDDFEVGDGRGPCPGSIGLPEEDIQCRCAQTFVLDTDPIQP